jgi:hypothetical protein
VTRLESLLLIAFPAQDAADSPEINGSRLPPHLRDAEDENIDDRLVISISVLFFSIKSFT